MAMQRQMIVILGWSKWPSFSLKDSRTIELLFIYFIRQSLFSLEKHFLFILRNTSTRESCYALNYRVITRGVFFSSSHALLRVHEKPTRKYSLFVIITSFFFWKNIFSKKILIFSIVVIMRNHGNQNILSSNYA